MSSLIVRASRTRADLASRKPTLGEDTEISRDEFFEHGLRTATNYDRTYAGTADTLADMLEEDGDLAGAEYWSRIAATAGYIPAGLTLGMLRTKNEISKMQLNGSG